MAEPMRVMTGAPSVEYQTNMNVETQWNLLKVATKNNYSLTGAIMKQNKYNLPTAHAYSILDAREITRAGQIVEKLVHIRNPHGFESYVGPWSDNDNRWTAEFKAQVAYKKGNDGGFFITFDDFRQIY